MFRYRQSSARRLLPASDYYRARGNQIIEHSSDNEKILCGRVNFASTSCASFQKLVETQNYGFRTSCFGLRIKLFAVDFCALIVDECKCRIQFTSQKSAANNLNNRNIREVWEIPEKQWKHSPVARVPTAFLFLSNFPSCFCNLIQKQKMFSTC